MVSVKKPFMILLDINFNKPKKRILVVLASKTSHFGPLFQRLF